MSKKSRRILALLKDPRHRERLMQLMNKDTMDDASPIGGDQGMKVLEEMNSLTDDHDRYVKGLMPRPDLL